MKRAYSVNDIHVVLNEIFLSHGLVADKWNALLICVKDNTTHNTFVSYLQSHLRNVPVDVNKVELCLDVVDFIIDCSFDCKLITVISSDEVMSYVVAVAQSKCVNKTFKNKIAYLINKWLRIFNLNKSHPAFKGFLTLMFNSNTRLVSLFQTQANMYTYPHINGSYFRLNHSKIFK